MDVDTMRAHTRRVLAAMEVSPERVRKHLAADEFDAFVLVVSA